MCNNCKWFDYDPSTGYAECSKEDFLTEEEMEKYFGDNQDGCPHKEERYSI